MNDSPLFRDTLALCGVLMECLEDEAHYDRLRLCLTDGALRLLDQITLALSGFERRVHLEEADMELASLRSRLFLALELGVLDQDTFLALAEQTDAVGRQLGGWLKKLRREVELGD